MDSKSSIQNNFLNNDIEKRKKKKKTIIVILILIILLGILGFLIYQVKFAEKSIFDKGDKYEEYDPNYVLDEDESNEQSSKPQETSNIIVGITSNVSSNANVTSNTINSNINIKNSNSNTSNNVNTKVTGVKFNDSNATIVVGDTKTLGITISPDTALNKAVTYKSSDESVATIDSNGKVTAKKKGTTNITVTTKDSGKSATVKLTVVTKAIPVTGIKSSTSSTKISIGGQFYFYVGLTISPSNATNKDITYKSSNTKVATVDSNGVVKGVSSGTAVITATTKDGNKTASVNVTVYQSVLAMSYSLPATLEVGKSYFSSATVAPNNATDKSVTYSSTNTSIATVDSSGKVTCKKAGMVAIWAKSNSEDNVSSLRNLKCVNSLTVNESPIRLESSVKRFPVPVQFRTTDDPKKVSISSSNKSIAYAIGNIYPAEGVGIIQVFSGNQYGTATITLKTSDGTTKDIKVTVDTYEVRLNIQTISKGGVCQLNPVGNKYTVYYNGKEINNWSKITIDGKVFTPSTAHGESLPTSLTGLELNVTVAGTEHNAIFTKTGGCN